MAMHTWPDVMNVAPAILSASAASMSVSGATMAASLPPSSSTTGRTAARRGGHHGPPGGHAAGERHHVHAGMGHEHLAELGARAVDGVDDARRQGVGQRGRPRPAPPRDTWAGPSPRRCCRPDRAGQHLVAEDRHRPVERQQGGDDAEGLVHHAGPCGRRRPSMVRAARASATSGANAPAIPPMVPGVELRLPQHLAVLAGEEGGQVLGLDGGAGGRRPPWPPARRAPRGPSPPTAGKAARAAATARSSCAGDAEGASKTTSAGRTGLVTG